MEGNAKEYSNYHTIAFISHASKIMFKILQARLQQYMNQELPDVQAGFQRSRGTWDQIANIRWIIDKARELQKNIYFCFTDYAKAFDCMDHNKLWRILKSWKYQTTLPVSWETHMQVKEQQLEPDMEQPTVSKLGKEYVEAVYCHPAYLTYMQNTSCEMPGWWSTSWNPEFQEKYQQPQICRWYHSNGRKWRGTKDLFFCLFF